MMRNLVLFAFLACPLAAQERIDLGQGWKIQSSVQVAEKGETISQAGYAARDWVPATVPTTVLAALVANKVYPDPDFGMNLRSIPGTAYGIGQNFSNLAMPADSPFARSWWYRTEFRIPPAAHSKTLWLNFDSINSRANIWLNGQQIADSSHVTGMYRMFEFDVTALVKSDGVNALAVEVLPPQPNDLTLTFVDWNPMPPDKDMGLVRDVYLLTSGAISLRDPQIVSKLDYAANDARLTVSATFRSTSDEPLEATFRLKIGNLTLSRPVRVDGHQSRRVDFTSAENPVLLISHPNLWWPNGLGLQDLYSAQFSVEVLGRLSDARTVTFGIREITSEIDSQGHRLFHINGRNILIRGGGWSPDMLLRFSPQREEDEIRYARDMHLNTIRLEGKLNNDHFFEACDRQGVLVLAGWCCCSFWERWRDWKPEDTAIAAASLRDQVRRIRNHPSVLAFLYGSDNAPPKPVEAAYLKVLQDERWPNPYIASAAQATTEGAGATGVKMTGPYDYVAPNYWLLDRQRGGAFGFNTETSPGPAIPEIASLRQMLPADHLWPIDEFWNFHAGGGSYRNVNLFSTALEARYGKARGLEDYVRKSQVMAYEGERAMFEAFGRNKYNSTGVIQWMLNNAWPSVIWHLYDYYLRPGGGYFGTKKACEPVHVQYSYDDGSIVVVNSLYRALTGYRVTAKVYNFDLSEKFSKTQAVDIPADSSTRVLQIADLTGLSPVYFVRLTLADHAGAMVSRNFYWLSPHPDVSDWSRGNGRSTPIQTYADLTALENLAPAKLAVRSKAAENGAEHMEHVVVENTGASLAFFVRLRLLKDASGEEIVPALWEDNDFELMPGEKREVAVECHRNLLGPGKPSVQAEAWNQ